MRNLLEETIDVLSGRGKSPEDVKWIGYEGNTGHYGSWDDFAKLADFDYDNGFGWEEINLSLVIVGDNWWLERQEYDGSEGWAFKTLPQRPFAEMDSYGLKIEHIKADH